MSLKESLSDKLTARALAAIPGLVGDLWGNARVPVWIQDGELKTTGAEEGRDEPRVAAAMNGKAIAEIYANTPYALSIEPLVVSLLRQPLNPEDTIFDVRAELIGWTEFMAADASLSVARLIFSLTGPINLEE